MYSFYLYFLGLSLKNTFKALDIFDDQKEVILLSVTGFKDLVLLHIRKRISAIIVDEILI